MTIPKRHAIIWFLLPSAWRCHLAALPRYAALAVVVVVAGCGLQLGGATLPESEARQFRDYLKYVDHDSSTAGRSNGELWEVGYSVCREMRRQSITEDEAFGVLQDPSTPSSVQIGAMWFTLTDGDC